MLMRKEHLAAAPCCKGDVVADFAEGIRRSLKHGKLAKGESLSGQIQILACLAPKLQFLPHPDNPPSPASLMSYSGAGPACVDLNS